MRRLRWKGLPMRLTNECLSPFETTNCLERHLARLLPHIYKRRLRGIVEAAPSWVTEEILSASERIGDRRAALWMSES
jgi:hypothetical protein